MREILFRGKRVDNGEWVEGYYFAVNQKYYIAKKIFSLPEVFNGETEMPIVIDNKTIGQYTGLTDKNGTKIFEGDIVLKRTYQGKKPMKVYFASGQFTCGVGGGSSTPSHYYTLNDNQIKIIGNIFDNSELIKE